MSHEFINTFGVVIGWIALTMVPAVIVVVAKLLSSTETRAWEKAVALYAALATCITGFVIVFAEFFAPR